VTEYQEFLETKRTYMKSNGKDVADADIHPLLFPFQRDVTRWAIRKGRALLGLDTGLGKTFCQLEWARHMADTSLVIAPLSVSRQTVREAKKIGLDVRYIRSMAEVNGPGIYITNYEMVEQMTPAAFGAVVLDESSILKSLDGHYRKLLTEMWQETPYRLCCTATPAPNDEAEIGMHSEFLGVMRHNEMLATFFIHANKVIESSFRSENGDNILVSKKLGNARGQEWRLRNYGKAEFYRWMASWAMMLRAPSDLGYDDDGFILPPLNIRPAWVDVDYCTEGQLLFTGLKGIQGRTAVRRATLTERVVKMAQLVKRDPGQWIIWCGLQAEADAALVAVPGAREVKGSDTPESKAAALESFQDGEYQVLVTKPKIAGFGMNFQNAHNMVFLGMNDSWEMYYQAIRREWRYGQKRPVNAHIVLSEAEREIYDNVMRKEAMAHRMKEELVKNMELYEKQELTGDIDGRDNSYHEDTMLGAGYTAMHGDCGIRLREIPDEIIDVSVYSPPFADLYTYSCSDHDLGNCRDWAEFFAHYAHIIRQIYRVTRPGRVTCVHTADIPAMAVKDGYIGMRDFPGGVIKAHEKEGWIYHGYAVVKKNPQAQAIRTKAHALLFASLRKDAAVCRPAILDRVLFFKKPGDNEVPITPVAHGEMDNETWIDWAGGIWIGVSESDTLQYTTARDTEDEKHICPLQLGTIERCIKLYSNPGETVLTPFMGIGSEAYQAIRFGRKAIGIELKDSYFRIAVDNLRDAARERDQPDLFNYQELAQ
jgi:DNA modification methylase